jgi:acyl carrier protein
VRDVAPRVPEEAILATLFAEVLGLSRVSIHDNFFESGGHSVLAGAVVARVRQSFRVELPVSAIFEAPTVATLALVIARLQTLRPI